MSSQISNQFTFKANSSHYDLGRESKIINQPSNKNYLSNKSPRKYKIFEQSPLFSKTPQKVKKLNASPSGYKTSIKKASIYQETGYKTLERSEQMPMTNKYKQLVEDTPSYKVYGGNEKEKILNELARKEREINILKLEIDRARRCQHLNTNNQEIYKRLINSQYQIIHQNPKQKKGQFLKLNSNYTPIQSLTQIKLSPKSKKYNAYPTHTNNFIDSASRYNSVPLKTIPQNQQNQIRQQDTQKILLIKNTPQRHRLNYSLQQKLYQADPLYLKMQSQMNASRRSQSKTNVNDLPLNMRLAEMNNTLQYKYKDYTRRTSLKHSQRKNKGELYLQNHYRY